MTTKATIDDAPAILELYRKVASIYPDGLTQEADKLNLTYIQSVRRQACLRGLVLLIFEEDIYR